MATKNIFQIMSLREVSGYEMIGQGINFKNLKDIASPCQVAQLVGVLVHTPKIFGFDFWSGHITST